MYRELYGKGKHQHYIECHKPCHVGKYRLLTLCCDIIVPRPSPIVEMYSDATNLADKSVTTSLSTLYLARKTEMILWVSPIVR